MRIEEFLHRINEHILNPLILVLFALATAVFIGGVVIFMNNLDSPEARLKGRNAILWGLIGMIIMFGTFTIIRILLNTFGIPEPDILSLATS